MTRTPSSRDWVKERSAGRRESDGGVCIWHDVCHETVAGIKQDGIDHRNSSKEELDRMKKEIETKLPAWIFKLFLATAVPAALALGGWISLNAFETAKIVTRIDTNQQHLMQEFNIKPVKSVSENNE